MVSCDIIEDDGETATRTGTTHNGQGEVGPKAIMQVMAAAADAYLNKRGVADDYEDEVRIRAAGEFLLHFVCCDLYADHPVNKKFIEVAEMAIKWSEADNRQP